MKLFNASKSVVFTLLLNFFVILSVCTQTLGSEILKREVLWLSGFTMPDLLEDTVEINSQADLSKLLLAPWYSEIRVIHTQMPSINSFSNSSQYLEHATDKTRTLYDHEMSSFLVLAKMSRATELLISAKGAKKSYLPKQILTQRLPELWPKELAFETSTKEAERNIKNTNIKFWGDINKQTSFEKNTDEQATYYHDGGQQVITLVGLGDFDNNGIEDLLVSSQETVEGGTYFNLRLFVLSVTPEGEWYLVNEHVF